MISISSQELESFVPVYDVVPEKWEDAREFLVEHLKKISNAVNIREIGFLLDQELLSGKQFIPSPSMSGNTSSTSQQFRTVLRTVVDSGPLLIGVNTIPHNINFDVNFTLTHLYVVGTNSVSFLAQELSGNSVIMNANNFVITSPAVFDRSFVICEYIQEL